LIGALIMAHSDDKGLIIPPKIADTKVVIVPILGKKSDPEAILGACRKLQDEINMGRSLVIDDRPKVSPGWKYHHWEQRGIPLRIELGARDLENSQAVLVRRDTGEKHFQPLDQMGEQVRKTLDAMQIELFEKAKTYRDECTFEVDDKETFIRKLEDPGGFLMAHHCGQPACEIRIQKETKATIRCIPLDAKEEKGTCPFCGEPSYKRVIFAKAY
jgi:prolyl-tRNA synthetase